MKICLAASAGGHLSQLLKLSESWERHEAVYISTTEVVQKELSKRSKVYIVGECNHRQPRKVFQVWMRCFRIISLEKPDIVISTGAAVGCMMCFLGKVKGAKVVWIDSVANVERISLSGRMVRFIADLFLVQWPQLADKYKKVEYVGAVI